MRGFFVSGGVLVGNGSDVIYKFGMNPDVDVSGGTDEDIIFQGGDAYFPDNTVVGTDIQVFSGSAADTAAGAGARTLTVIGLDSDFLPQSETVSLAGTAVVNLANDYARIFRGFVASAGTSATQGTITVQDSAGTFIQISPDYQQTLHGAFTIPANYLEAYMVEVVCSLIGGAAATTWAVVALEMRSVGGVWLTKDIMQVSGDAPLRHDYVRKAINVTPMTDVRMRAKDASGASLTVSGNFEIISEAVRLNRYL